VARWWRQRADGYANEGIGQLTEIGQVAEALLRWAADDSPAHAPQTGVR
jgi:hypothetical protein